MTDKPFQTPPLPPQAPNFQAFPKTQPIETPVSFPVEKRNQHDEAVADDFATRFKLSPTIYRTKSMLAILGGTLFAGLLLGIMFFGGGSTAPASVSSGLQGVIQNPEIQQNLARCGTVPETEPCIVYIVNHTRADRYAEYFFDQAVKLTGRQPYLLEIANRQYAKTRIPRGYIAKIQVPRL